MNQRRRKIDLHTPGSKEFVFGTKKITVCCMFNVILSCKLKKMFDLGYMRAEREATVGYKKVDRRDLYEAILG